MLRGAWATVDDSETVVTVEPAASLRTLRPQVKGKFLCIGDRKLYLRGVTYGPFRPNDQGHEYHDRQIVERDFALMAVHGFNTVRTYTVPPRWLLDVAAAYGLYVLIGLPWEQHITFLDSRHQRRDIESRVRAGVRACSGHPAVLGYTIGNEIPASIVRWYGRRRIERFLERLYRAAKAEDPDGLVTYVNFPTTEYLQLPFVDFVCFNVYLESPERLEAYLARLQNLADERPLVLAEVGLDSIRHGELAQALTLQWQIRSVFGCGSAGLFLFAWTDEWFRGGCEIEDWAFGMTDRDRQPKPALTVVGQTFEDTPFCSKRSWPRISVVVCTHNGSRTIADCCEGLGELDYPDYEVIVVNDGSSDTTESIARKFRIRVITVNNGGLSRARNIGLHASTGQIVAYLDDDARPDPHWLKYVALSFADASVGGVGGPNIAPAGDGWVADCVANAPGGPSHVLLDDQIAEHIPGCNMAFRKECLEAVGGFDAQFHIAGDDVDVCWRVQDRGWRLAFNPAAVVWHHRRNSLRAYWRQQLNYGRAEAMLERKWPGKYNAAGHVPWAGRLYGRGLIRSLHCLRSRIYHGTWGSAPFQSMYAPAPGVLASLPMMPEWYIVTAALAILAGLGAVWPTLLWSVPLLAAAVLLPLVHACLGAAHASFTDAPRSRTEQIKKRIVTAMLHCTQPLARLWGRLSFGLTPWRKRGAPAWSLPRPRRFELWTEQWQPPEQWLTRACTALRESGAVVRHGGDYDRWDLYVRGGLLGACQMRMAIEEHGGGQQLIRFGAAPEVRSVANGVSISLACLAVGAGLSGAWPVCFCLTLGFAAVALRTFYECGLATTVVCRAMSELAKAHKRAPAPLPVTADSQPQEQLDSPHDAFDSDNGDGDLAVAGRQRPAVV